MKVKRIKGNLCHAGGRFTPCNKAGGATADATSRDSFGAQVRKKIARREPGKGGEIRMSKREIDFVLRKANFALISAGPNPNIESHAGMSPRLQAIRDKNLRSDLAAAGYVFVRAKGRYDGLERSVWAFIPNAEKSDAINLGKKYEQDSVIYSEAAGGRSNQMVFTTGPKRDKFFKGAGWQYEDKAENYYTAIRTTDGPKSISKWTLNFNFDELNENGPVLERAGVKRIRGNLCHSRGKFTSCSRVSPGPSTTPTKARKVAKVDPIHGKDDRLGGKFKLKVMGGDATFLRLLDSGTITKKGDMCKIHPPFCSGNFGVPRSKMPQLDDATTARFIDSLRKDGVGIKKQWQSVGDLKATQREINAAKVTGMARSLVRGKFPNISKAIIVSKDGYILDGHHRWAAMVMAHPENKIRTVTVDMPIKRMLRMANGFKGVKQRGLAETFERLLAERKGKSCCSSCKSGGSCEGKKSRARSTEVEERRKAGGSSLFRRPLPPRFSTDRPSA